MCMIQEGDKFVRLPEAYVKGNNVCLCSPSQGGSAVTDQSPPHHRSNTSESPTRSST